MVLLGGESFALDDRRRTPARSRSTSSPARSIAVGAALLGARGGLRLPVRVPGVPAPPVADPDARRRRRAARRARRDRSARSRCSRASTQMQELTATVERLHAGRPRDGMAVIKLIAVVIAGTAGFRGGRIFPSVFVAVAFGLFVNTVFPQIPEAIAVSASLIGILLAVTRSGWIALFMGGLMVDDPTLVPLLAIIVLPAWLVVTGRPEMVIKVRADRRRRRPRDQPSPPWRTRRAALASSRSAPACSGVASALASSRSAAGRPARIDRRPAAAERYCTDQGGMLVDRVATWNTNARPVDQWLQLAGRDAVVRVRDGPRRPDHADLGRPRHPVLGGADPGGRRLPVEGHAGRCRRSPAPTRPSTTAARAWAEPSTFGDGAAGGGWVDASQPVFVVMDLCVFEDMSAIDAFGLLYHADGTVRGRRPRDEDALPAGPASAAGDLRQLAGDVHRGQERLQRHVRRPRAARRRRPPRPRRASRSPALTLWTFTFMPATTRPSRSQNAMNVPGRRRRPGTRPGPRSTGSPRTPCSGRTGRSRSTGRGRTARRGRACCGRPIRPGGARCPSARRAAACPSTGCCADGDVARGEDARARSSRGGRLTRIPLSTARPAASASARPGRRADPDDHEVGVDPRPVGRLDGLDRAAAARGTATTRWSGDQPHAVLGVDVAVDRPDLRPEHPLQRDRGVGDRRVTSRPSCRIDAATSAPIQPPPMTTTRCAVPAACAERIRVVDRAQVPDPVEVVARDRRAGRGSEPGRDQQPVEPDAPTVAEDDLPRPPRRWPRPSSTARAPRAARRTTPRDGRRPCRARRRRAGTPWTAAGGCTADAPRSRTGRPGRRSRPCAAPRPPSRRPGRRRRSRSSPRQSSSSSPCRSPSCACPATGRKSRLQPNGLLLLTRLIVTDFAPPSTLSQADLSVRVRAHGH